MVKIARKMKDESSLEAEVRHYYELFMQAPVAITVFRGPSFVIEFANPLVCESWGRKHKEVINKPLFEAIPESIGQGFEELLSSVLTTGKTIRMTEVPVDIVRNGEKKKIYYSFVFQPLYEKSAEIGGIVVVSNDVTEQVLALKQKDKLAEQMSQNAKIFETALSSITDFIYTFDTSGRFIYSNKPLLDLLDIKLKQIIGKNFHDLPYPKELATTLQKQIAHVVKTGESVTGETRFVSPTGHTGYYEYILKPVFGTDGRVELVGGSTRDVTERKLSEERLQRQLQVTKTITDMATACLVMVDNEGIITYMNPAAEKVTGNTLKKAVGKPLHSLVHHSHPDRSSYPAASCPLVSTYKHGDQTPLHEDVFFRKDGSQFSVLISGTPILGKQGQQGTVVEFRDIGDEKIAQRKQLELVAITEQRNALLKVNKTKDEFIALASHQLRTPATAVKQYIALLMDEYAGPIPAEQSQYLQAAYDSNERELKIINDLLKTAQIDSNKYRLDKKSHSVVKILQEALSDLRTIFELKNQTVQLRGFDADIKVECDSTEMKLVFMNLLENASKYSYPHTEIKVSVQSNDHTAVVLVADNGVGVSKENQQRIFDKFTRVDNELSDTITGTGLGLYWVKQIVELHQGSVKLITTPGKGSTFVVNLPL